MKIIKIDPKKPDIKIIKHAAKVLKRGGLLVYPTDTAYGLAGNALKPDVIKFVLYVKERSNKKPTHVVVKNWDMVKRLTKSNANAKILFNKFLPGPLTIILPKRKIVPDILTGGLPTLGIRIPDNPVTKQLSNLVSFPYTTPSANRSKGKTPYSISDVRKHLDIKKVDLILDAGTLPKTLPSTIVNLSTSKTKVLREGPISSSEIKKALNE